MNGRVLLALSLTVNFGLIGWLGLQWSRRSMPPPNAVVKTVRRVVPPARPEPASTPAAPAPERTPEFRWRQIESEDYPTYITNLRSIGCPEKTIRDILLADVEKLYQSRLKASQQTNHEPFWRTAEQREKARRESNRRERELNREKRAMIKALLGLDYDQAALEAWWDEQEFAIGLNFLPAQKPVEVIALVNRFGEEDNEIDDRAGGILTPEDVASKKSCFNRLLAELGQLLTPSQLEEGELRFTGAMAFEFDEEDRAKLNLTGVELRELVRLKWQWDSPLNEELEWQDQALEQQRRRGREQLEMRARRLLGDDRFAAFLLKQNDSGFGPVYDLAERHSLSHSAALQAHDILNATTDEITRVRRDRTLRASQRRAQMQDIRQTAEQALQQTLGDDALADYLEQDAPPWMLVPDKR
jgi:hypothetical protein